MNEFGEFLYTLRKEKGMTQSELAKLLGVTNKAVSKWETGEAMPETALLMPISRIFGVSVDELLAGKRSERPADEKEEVENDGLPEIIKSHMFTRGKDDNDEKTLPEIIGGALCATVVFAGLLIYFLLGIIYELWHPYWVIIPVSALSSGIIGTVFDVCSAKKRERKIARGENPYTGAICGVIMLICIIVYLILGAFLSLWHPMWIILVAGAFTCGLIAMLIEIINHRNK